jgi:DNA-binding transcriptional regulator YhcF (GntR family)
MPILNKSQQVEDLLKQRISSGEYAPGEMMPRERDLAVMLGVSRTTVRDALRGLTDMGLLLRVQGSGTYVAKQDSKGTIALVSELGLVASKYGYTHQKLITESQKLVDADGYTGVLSIGNGSTPEEFLKSIRLQDNREIEKVTGAIITAGMMELDARLAQAGIPSVSISSATALSDNAVVLDFDMLFHEADKAFKAAGVQDFVVMFPDYMLAKLYDRRETMVKKFNRLINDIVEGDTTRLLPISEANIESAGKVFMDWWNSPNCSKAILFVDDALFGICRDTINALEADSSKDLKIITHFNLGRPVECSFPCLRLGFDLNEVTTEAWSILKEVMSNPDHNGIVRYIEPITIDNR